jgi:hypothetical protein
MWVKFIAFASISSYDETTFCPLKKDASLFFNSDFVGTAQKEATY